MSINQEERAFRAWNILANCSKAQTAISYGNLAKKLGIHHRADKFLLELIQNYCLEAKLPPLTILVINQSGKPGPGFIAWDVDNFEEGKRLVFSYNWESIKNPFEYAKGDHTQEEIADTILQRGTIAEYEQIVKVRGIAQEIFKKILLKAYNAQCCICGISQIEVLEAAHIKSWYDCSPSEKISVDNGLLLCSIHHKLFDKGIIRINKEYRVIVDLGKVKDNEPERSIIRKFNGEKIRLPKKTDYYPKKEYLQQYPALLRLTPGFAAP